MAIVANSGNIIPTVLWSTSQDVTISGTSAQSTAIGTAGEPLRRIIRICSTTACRVITGSNPTAVATSTLLPANVVEFMEIVPGDKVAGIQESAGGKLNITECKL